MADEYEAVNLRWVGGAQRPVWRGNAPKKTGARSARARTRGQNPLVQLYCNKKYTLDSNYISVPALGNAVFFVSDQETRVREERCGIKEEGIEV